MSDIVTLDLHSALSNMARQKGLFQSLQDSSRTPESKCLHMWLSLELPYSRVIRRISHISAYSLISAYAFPVTNTHC